MCARVLERERWRRLRHRQQWQWKKRRAIFWWVLIGLWTSIYAIPSTHINGNFLSLCLFGVWEGWLWRLMESRVSVSSKVWFFGCIFVFVHAIFSYSFFLMFFFIFYFLKDFLLNYFLLIWYWYSLLFRI